MRNGNIKKKPDNNSSLPVMTIVLFSVMYVVGILMPGGRGFVKVRNLLNLSISDAGLIMAATGTTIAMIIGGIDISVGSAVAMTRMMLAWMMEKGGTGAILVVITVLLTGCVFGLVQNFLVAHLKIQPSIVTLADVFLTRGMVSIISQETISINNETSKSMAAFKVYLPFGDYLDKRGIMVYPYIYPSVIIVLVILVLIFTLLEYTKFGRSIYAIDGNEQPAPPLGLNVRKIEPQAYVLDGFLAGPGGLLFCMNTCSGFAEWAKGFEVDAIASSVIDDTLLTGGAGNVTGSLFGVLIKGTIELPTAFRGTLLFRWTRITITTLPCFFTILQGLIAAFKRRDK